VAADVLINHRNGRIHDNPRRMWLTTHRPYDPKAMAAANVAATAAVRRSPS